MPRPENPHSIEAEEATLGALMIDPTAALKVSSQLVPGDFFITKHRWLCEAIYTLARADQPADPITVAGKLADQGHLENAGGIAWVTGLIQSAPSSQNVEAYACQVADDAQRRRLIDAATSIAKVAYDLTTPVDQARLLSEQALTEAVRSRDNGHISDAMAVALEVSRRLEDFARSKFAEGGTRYLDTGWTDLNRAIGGWRPTLIGVMAIAHMGKSYFALHTTAAACRAGKRVMTFTPEMTATQLVERLCLSRARVKKYTYERGALNPVQTAAFDNILTEVSEWDWLIDDQTVEIGALVSAATLAHLHKPLDLIVVDPIGLLSGGDKTNRHQELGYYTKLLKNLSKKLECPVMAVHHIGTKAVMSRGDKRPRQSDGYETGHFDQFVDVLLGLHRDDFFRPIEPKEDHDHIMEVLVLKDKVGGGTGFGIKLVFTAWGDIQTAELHQQEPPPDNDDPVWRGGEW